MLPETRSTSLAAQNAQLQKSLGRAETGDLRSLSSDSRDKLTSASKQVLNGYYVTTKFKLHWSCGCATYSKIGSNFKNRPAVQCAMFIHLRYEPNHTQLIFLRTPLVYACLKCRM